jgi:hypothetical protein
MSSGWKAGAAVADGAATGFGRAVSVTGTSSAAREKGTLQAAIRIAFSTAIDNGARADESNLECRVECRQFTPMELPAWQRKLGILRMGIVRILMRAEKRQREYEDEHHVAARPARIADRGRHTRWDTNRLTV